MQCYECEQGELKKQKVEYFQYGISLGKFEAEVCTLCKEVFYSADVVQKIENESKKKGLFGLGTKTKIGTSGTALDVKLPKALVDFMNLQKGKQVKFPITNESKYYSLLVELASKIKERAEH